MQPVVLPVSVAEEVWTILVETCGADNREPHHSDFVRFAANQGITEYRFMGKLGFGGKVYAQGGFWVSCYPEDRTPERLQMILEANKRLKPLWS